MGDREKIRDSSEIRKGNIATHYTAKKLGAKCKILACIKGHVVATIPKAMDDGK